MWENNNYTLRFEKNPFYRHEQVILASASYDGYLPMTFLRDSHGLIVRYETGSFLPLSGYRIERTADALYLMEKTLLILYSSPEHLLAPERILLTTETVFYSKKSDQLKIAFLPHPSHGTNTSPVSPFRRDLILFLAQLRQDLCDSRAEFLLRLARDMYYSCPAAGDMLRSIGLLRRELDAIPPDYETSAAS